MALPLAGENNKYVIRLISFPKDGKRYYSVCVIKKENKKIANIKYIDENGTLKRLEDLLGVEKLNLKAISFIGNEYAIPQNSKPEDLIKFKDEILKKYNLKKVPKEKPHAKKMTNKMLSPVQKVENKRIELQRKIIQLRKIMPQAEPQMAAKIKNTIHVLEQRVKAIEEVENMLRKGKTDRIKEMLKKVRRRR